MTAIAGLIAGTACNGATDLQVDTGLESGAAASAEDAVRERRLPASAAGPQGDDIALVGGKDWYTLPVAQSNRDGSFKVTNEIVGSFSLLAATANVKRLSGDFDGDGRTDFALVGIATWPTVPVAFSRGSGKFAVTNLPVNGAFMPWTAIASAKVVTGDFNGDGRTDIAVTGPSGWTWIGVAFSRGDGSFTVNAFSVGSFGAWASDPKAQVLAADFNGDGRTDLALTGVPGWTTIPVATATGATAGGFAVTNTGAGDFPAWASNPKAKVLVGDYNGDGRADIALTGDPSWYTIPIATSIGIGNFRITNIVAIGFSLRASSPGIKPMVGDFNGDGRSDIALVGQYQSVTLPMAVSLGDGSFTFYDRYVGEFTYWSSLSTTKILLGDFNLDGRTDIALVGPAPWYTLPVAFSTGDGFFSISNKPIASFNGWATPDVSAFVARM